MTDPDALTEQLYIRVTPEEKAAIKALAYVDGNSEEYGPYVRDEAIRPLIKKYRRWEQMHPASDAA